MAKRSKPTPNMRVVTTPEGVNEALRELADVKRMMMECELEMNHEIDAAKAAAELVLAPLKIRLQGLEAGLAAYGEFHRADFEERRSQEFMFGTIGWRKSTELKPKGRNTWKCVLEKLQALSFISAIRTRADVNREDLLTWPDGRLELVGVQRVEKDHFWYEVKADSVEGCA